MALAAHALAAPPAKPKAPTAAQRADYKKHMKSGWALQKQSKWAEAVKEFEAALVAIDGDQRALGELGFSAASAGDFVKARRADEQAVQVAGDKKVKAAALYNLGQVLEKSGDKDGALRAYHASVQLRPNDTVDKAIAHLGSTPSAEPPFCGKGEKPCDCITRAQWGGDEAKCAVRTDPPSPIAGLRVFHVKRDLHSESWDYMLDEHDQLAAIIGGGFEYGYGRFYDSLELDKAEIRAIAGHRVAWIQTTDTYQETDPETTTIETTKTTHVTLCLLGDAKTATHCPLRDVPIVQVHDAEKTTTTKLDLAIADDGTATLKLLSGPSDDQINALVGPHKLW